VIVTCNGFKYYYNKIVHDVDFNEAAECIFSTQAIVHNDTKHSLVEDRFNLISISPNGRVLSVGFCKRQNNRETRIISARIASRKERAEYAASFPSPTFQTIKHNNPIQKVRLRLWSDIFVALPVSTLALVVSKKFKNWLYHKK
jgi:uncharacterized DUF497 family protein